MAFDQNRVEAQLALNLIASAEMPALAWDALEAGLDGPAIRRMAALEHPTFFEIQDVLPQAMQEMRLSEVGKGDAALRLAKLRAQEILRSGSDVLKHATDFHHLWLESDYCPELWDYGNLAEEVYVAKIMGQDESEIRAWVLDRLEKLATAQESG